MTCTIKFYPTIALLPLQQYSACTALISTIKFWHMMKVSQPRRVAASSLMERVRLTLTDRVGLRMGPMVRDESPDTVIFYITTGYLVKLAAHHLETFNNHTHLIVDEVHGRTVDRDLLCYLAKKLLDMHPHLHLVLMSATLNFDLYNPYFRVFSPAEPIFVGLRPFQIKIKYLEDILLDANLDKADKYYTNAIQELSNGMGTMKCKQNVRTNCSQ